MVYGKKDIKKNIFLWNVYFNQFLLFEIKHPDFEELDSHSYSGTNIQKGNVHQYNSSNNTAIALLQVSWSLFPSPCPTAYFENGL